MRDFFPRYVESSITGIKVECPCLHLPRTAFWVSHSFLMWLMHGRIVIQQINWKEEKQFFWWDGVMWERGKFYFEIDWWQILCVLSVFLAACIDILGDSWQDWQLWEPSFAAALQESGGFGAGYDGTRTSWGSYKWELLVGVKGGRVEGSWLCCKSEMCYDKTKCLLKNILVVCSSKMQNSGCVHSEIWKPYFLMVSLLR